MRSLLAFSLTALAMSLSVAAHAAQVQEQEVNHPIEKAKGLASYDIAAKMGGAAGDQDADFFVMYGKSGKAYEINVTGINRARIAVFDANGDYIYGNTPKSSTTTVLKNVFPSSGKFVIGVINAGVRPNERKFEADGTVTSTGAAKASEEAYTVLVTGAEPAVKQVGIRVKPGVKHIAPPFNPKSNGTLPVAILGAADFHVTAIDKTSLKFGPEGTESSLSSCNPAEKDVNKDGIVDILCHFSLKEARFAETDSMGKLTGVQTDGTAFEGQAFLKVLPVPFE